MGLQDPRTFIHRPSALLQTAFIAALVLVTSCYASPLSLVPHRLERTASTVSNIDLPLCNHPDYDYSSESKISSTVHPRHLQDSRDVGWTKALDKLAMKLDGMALIGYSYAEDVRFLYPLELRPRWITTSPSLMLPGTDRPLSTTNHLYLVSKPNSLVNKLENTNTIYWTCPVYAKKSRMKKEKPQLVYEEGGEPPLYTPGPPPPPYSERPTVDVPSPGVSPVLRDSNRIIFFEEQKVGVIMRIPWYEFKQKWNMSSECYKTGRHLKAAKWNEIWKPEVQGWPKNVL
ncbi:hypothetical protein F5876DRAFT_79781 [Lentinula aff. lateritia]|uniref:Uncharacterized protein n=1 Tax=Lentinula aff. lateritia TaxID=2804960 RepID=A0ACC1TRL1_9AGAR|nr:hypothetical protein F5876DRAFT_79781 [Lentinula aff. lateritia]